MLLTNVHASNQTQARALAALPPRSAADSEEHELDEEDVSFFLVGTQSASAENTVRDSCLWCCCTPPLPLQPQNLRAPFGHSWMRSLVLFLVLLVLVAACTGIQR